MSIEPFKIDVADNRLAQLQHRLSFYPTLSISSLSTDWERGCSPAAIQRLVNYWRNGFDWRAAEAELNTMPQYLAKFTLRGHGHAVHFVHQTSGVPGAIPLLFLHGWPGSFIEVSRILAPLTKITSEGVVFDVVAPSLLNFGFSTSDHGIESTIEHNADAIHELMRMLGYTKYAIQAGDLGYLVTRILLFTGDNDPSIPTQDDLDGLSRTTAFSESGDGYFKLAMSKPSTIAVALSDSPAGLLAWLYEKLHDWVDDYTWTDDEILTWISIHWFASAGPAACTHAYYEIGRSKPPAFEASQAYSEVPIGISRFPKDIILLPKAWHATLGPVVFWRAHDKGGHFAAWEQPEALVQDTREVFKSKFAVERFS